MLVEVRCDKFISNGKVREPIRFHAGLNVVLGDDNGSNSIGKSTFLMILDFVFGGIDYIQKCVDVQENVKEHTICFAFDFGGQMYYFSRNTIDYNKIVKCDAGYQALPDEKPLSLQKYGEFLCEQYALSAEGTTWRGAIARFIRVYKRDTLDEERPLRSSKDENTADAIKGYMRLYDRYSSVEAQIKQAAKAEDEKETFRKSTQEYNHVRAAKNDKEKAANETRIAELEQQEQALIADSDRGLLVAEFFVRADDNAFLQLLLSKKVFLVEGATEFLLLPMFYQQIIGNTIEEDGISVISCNGISYKRYLEIAKATDKKIAVVTDNDKKAHKITEAVSFNQVNSLQHIFMGATVDEWTWEACVYKENKTILDGMIDVQAGATYKFHDKDYGAVLGKMLNSKVDVAYQMLTSGKTFAVPQYIKDAIEWLRK